LAELPFWHTPFWQVRGLDFHKSFIDNGLHFVGVLVRDLHYVCWIDNVLDIALCSVIIC
jgi:hypothetical protein